MTGQQEIKGGKEELSFHSFVGFGRETFGDGCQNGFRVAHGILRVNDPQPVFALFEEEYRL